MTLLGLLFFATVFTTSVLGIAYARAARRYGSPNDEVLGILMAIGPWLLFLIVLAAVERG